MSPTPAEWIPQLKIMAKKVNQIYFDESFTSRMDSSIGSISHKIPEPIICFEPGRLSPGEPPSTIQPLSIFLFNGALSSYTNTCTRRAHLTNKLTVANTCCSASPV